MSSPRLAVGFFLLSLTHSSPPYYGMSGLPLPSGVYVIDASGRGSGHPFRGMAKASVSCPCTPLIAYPYPPAFILWRNGCADVLRMLDGGVDSQGKSEPCCLFLRTRSSLTPTTPLRYRLYSCPVWHLSLCSQVRRQLSAGQERRTYPGTYHVRYGAKAFALTTLIFHMLHVPV